MRLRLERRMQTALPQMQRATHGGTSALSRQQREKISRSVVLGASRCSSL